MRALLHKSFEKQFKKLRPNEKQRFKERRNIFLENPFDPILNNHDLKGRYERYRSINITGDWRAVSKLLDKNTAVFTDIDTHSHLYK